MREVPTARSCRNLPRALLAAPTSAPNMPVWTHACTLSCHLRLLKEAGLPLCCGQHSACQHCKREKLYIFSSHLGLIRCLTHVRVSAIIYFQAFLDKHRNTTNIILPHKLNHGSRMLSKQP